MNESQPISKVFQPNVMLQIQIFSNSFLEFMSVMTRRRKLVAVWTLWPKTSSLTPATVIMTQNFLATVSPGNCSHMKCHHLLPVLQEYQVSATDSCQHISCRGYLRHFVIFIIHDFSALSWLMLSTGHWPNLFKILYFEFSIKFTNMVRISEHWP